MRLTFIDDADRYQDEIASIIPKKLWDKYFNHSLTELERDLLKASDVSSISIDTRGISNSRKVCVLISILCHSQKINFKELSKKLNFDVKSFGNPPKK